MEIKQNTLKNSRVEYALTIPVLKVAEYYETALKRLGLSVKVSGFRPGKAPAHIIRDQIKPEMLREEAYSLAVQDAWREVAENISKSDKEQAPIQDPEVDVIEFEEGKPANIKFAFDIRPKVTVKNYQKIKLPKITKRAIGDKEVDEIINNLRKNSAKTVITLEPAKMGDKVECDFVGSIGGVTKDKLSSKHFPVILGEGSVIPGFAEELVGLKKSDQKTFTLTFPKEHFDKEFAGQKVTFAVTIEEVYSVILPEVNEEFVANFGHKNVDEFKATIKADLEKEAEQEVQTQEKAAWLAEFEKCVDTEIPQSLIEAEVARSRTNWQDFLASRHLNQEEWLKARQITLEQLTADWQKAAVSSVKIGLGLAEVGAEQKKDLAGNEQYNKFLDELVASAQKSK